MALTLKEGTWPGRRPDPEVARAVAAILEDVRRRGEAAVREASRNLDGWDPPAFVLSEGQIVDATRRVPVALAEHLDWAARNVERFARAQRSTLRPLQVEVLPGLRAGHRHVPVASVACLVPSGGARLATALTGILTARVAGVGRVEAVIAPEAGRPDPAAILAASRAGADGITILGGVQAAAAAAFGGVPGLRAVDMVVGPGDRSLAEAKRQLAGVVGTDQITGPPEVLVIADGTADPGLVAIELLSRTDGAPQAVLGLVTTDRGTGERVIAEVTRLLATGRLPDTARLPWEHAAVIVVDDLEEAVSETDARAPGQVVIHVEDSEFLTDRLANYGTLVIGDRSSAAHGDGGAGLSAQVPAGGAARHSGTIWIGSFLRTVTFQTADANAAAAIAGPVEAIARAERRPGAALAAAARSTDG